MDSKYFARTARYMKPDARVLVIERQRTGLVELRDWQKMMFLNAHGDRTVGVFLADLAASCAGGMPAAAPGQVHKAVTELVTLGFIALHKAPTTLPYYLAMPVELQDKALAREQMLADGFPTP